MKCRILHILFLLFVCTVTFAQEMRIVSGIIKDDTGEPIIGVSVTQKGTTNDAITDLNGYYEIKVPLGSTIRFSYIGMRTSEMVVTTSNSKPAGDQPIVRQTASVPTGKNEPDNGNNEKNGDLKAKPEEVKITPTREDQSLSPYFLVKSNSPQTASMPLKKTDVSVNIAGVIADVCVRQIYTNESQNILEAIYIFPGSTRAAVYGMSMTIGDRHIEAKIKKKEQARQEYEQAKSEGKSTTLLEQHRPNVFQMNVANILPGDTIVVEMRYTELLEHEGGLYEFIYPTVVGPRYSESGEEWVDRSIAQLESGIIPQFSIQTTIQAGMPIRKISSVSHNLTIESQSPDQAVVSLSNPKDREGTRDYILQYELQGGKVESGLLRYEHGDENFFLLMVQPPKKPTSDQIPPREYVFIVDVSGSMYGFPIQVSKELIRNLASSLRPIDRFNVMLFESSNAMLYKESLPATEENIQRALDVIDRQEGNGGTRMYPAIMNAMNFKETKGFSRTFIVVTDGFVTVEREAFNYIRSHLNEANLFPFGIGTSVNRYMIEGLAHAGMGTPYIVTNLTQAEKIGKKAILEISQPVLTNISVDWGDFDVYDVEPAAIPDVFAQRPILIYGKYKTPAMGTITVSGLAGNSMYEQKFDVSKAREEHNQALRYLWARNQIRYYDDYAQYYEGDGNSWYDVYGKHQRSAQQIEQVTNLGLKYNLLTQYTSFLAVDQEVRVSESGDTKAYYSTKSKSSYSSPESVTTPDFKLTADASTLEEVVVVGYGVSRTRYATGCAHSTVSANEVPALLTLQGRVAGLQVTPTSGEPGNASKVRIRGSASILDNNSPLVVLDGVPVEYSDFSQMNPNTIESISVLKEASAAAIYGSRGANGVLVITTKMPGYRKPQISFSSTFSVENPNQLPKLQHRFAQGRPENGTPVWNPSAESFSWGPEVHSVNAPTYDPYDLFETGYSCKNHFALSGRKRNFYYRLNLGNNTQNGFIPKSGLSETSAAFKLGRDNHSKFNYSIDLEYKYTRGKRLQRGYNLSGIMQGILLTPPTFDSRVSTLPDGSQNLAGNAANNPYWLLDKNPFSDKANRFTGRVNLAYKLNRRFTLHYLLNGNYSFGESETSSQRLVNYPPLHEMRRKERFRFWDSRFTTDFIEKWGDINLTSTIGYEYTASKRTIDRRDVYVWPQLENPSVLKSYKPSFSRHSHVLFGTANLGYRQMIHMEAGMRSEWSSVGNTALLSPTVGLAVNLQEMFRCDPFTLMKLRATVSRTDKEIPLYLDPAYFNSAVYNLNDEASHFESREVLLPDQLSPEKVVHYEAGADWGFWNNRFTLSTSWYWKNSKNQLLPIQTSDSFVQLENSGTLKTHGFEAELGMWLIQRRYFSWNTKIAFTRERNRVTRLGGRRLMLSGIEGEAGSYAIEGQPLGVLYGTVYQRDDQGHMRIGDDGYPIKSKECQVLGNPNPDWQLGWLHTLEYRNFSFTVLVDYKKGGDMWNGTQNVMNYYGTSKYSADHRNTTNYIFPGVLSDGRTNNIPVNFYGNTLDENRWVRYGKWGVGEDAIEDASCVKLREISLGYRIPLRVFREKTNLKVSVFATNILLYSKYKGVDPETNLTGSSNGLGLDYFNIPGAHSIGVSASWEF